MPQVSNGECGRIAMERLAMIEPRIGDVHQRSARSTTHLATPQTLPHRSPNVSNTPRYCGFDGRPWAGRRGSCLPQNLEGGGIISARMNRIGRNGLQRLRRRDDPSPADGDSAGGDGGQAQDRPRRVEVRTRSSWFRDFSSQRQKLTSHQHVAARVWHFASAGHDAGWAKSDFVLLRAWNATGVTVPMKVRAAM